MHVVFHREISKKSGKNVNETYVHETAMKNLNMIITYLAIEQEDII